MFKVNLAAARKNVGLTQTQAAKRLNISTETLINWEKYRTSPDASKLEDISSLYKIPIDNLKFSEDNPL